MLHMLAHPKVRMLVAGAVSLLVAYCVFLVLIHFRTHYQFASVAGFLVYLSISFVIHKKWSFQSAGNTTAQTILYACFHVCNQLLIMAGLYVLVELGSLDPRVAQLAMQAVASTLAFLIIPLIFGHR